MTSEPLNSTLVAFFLGLAAIFAAAGMLLLASAAMFLVSTRRYRRVRGHLALSPEQEAGAALWLRRGHWGLGACLALVLFYLLRSWVGELYYDDIARGLVPFSPAWWVVWSVSAPYYASLLAGLVGTVTMLVASRNLTRLMRPSGGGRRDCRRGPVSLIVTARLLLAVDGMVWAAFALLLWTGTVSVGDVGSATVSMLSALMLANAAALGLFAWQVFRGRRAVDVAAIALLAVNAVLSFTDQVGLADLLVLALNLAILTVLVLGMRVNAREP